MFVIEYSVRQKAFHVQDLQEMLTKNIMNSIKKVSLDYQVIGFADSRESADDFIESLRDEYEEFSL